MELSISCEITKRQLESLNGESIKILSDLLPLLDEAKTAENIIKKAYSFRMGEDEIIIWNDGNNKEILTHSGWWKARYLHQSYDVKCDTNGIFAAFKERYFKKDGALAPDYFRSFVEKAKKRLE